MGNRRDLSDTLVVSEYDGPSDNSGRSPAIELHRTHVDGAKIVIVLSVDEALALCKWLT